MKQHKAVAALGAVVLIASLAACSSSGGESTSDGTVRLGFEAAPQTWDPASGEVSSWLGAPYETLIAIPAEGSTELEPLLAESWEVDDSSITFQLRDDVVFHDGTPFDAEAVKFNIEHNIEGAGQWAGSLSAIDSVDVVDDHTVKVNLTFADPSLLGAFASQATYMGSPTAIADGSIATAPAGTSPWAYDAEASVEGGDQVFVAFDDYWGGEVENRPTRLVLTPLDDPQGRFNALLAGDVDIADVDVSLYQQAIDAGLDTSVYNALLIAFVLFDRGPGGTLESIDARRAFCSGVSSQNIMDATGVSEVSEVLEQRFPENSPFYVEDLVSYPFDTEAAKGYLADAGLTSLDLTTAAFGGNQTAFEAAAGDLAQAGINLQIQTLEPSQFFAEWNSGKYSVGAASSAFRHPAQWYASYFAADAPNNPSGVESPELAAAAAEARAAGLSPEADALWNKVVGIIYSEALVCGEFSLPQINGYDPEVVTGVRSAEYETTTIDYGALRLVD